VTDSQIAVHTICILISDAMHRVELKQMDCASVIGCSLIDLDKKYTLLPPSRHIAPGSPNAKSTDTNTC